MWCCCKRLAQQVLQKDDVGGVPEACWDGAAGLTGYYDFEEFGGGSEIGQQDMIWVGW